jgi:hydroxyacylglutathione hydrolase
MLFERIESEGLAHYSYLIGDGGEAAVIDPRRDCTVYVDRAARAGYHILHVLETHRNEDYLVGSLELAGRTGAQVWHADAQWDYEYPQAVEDAQVWKVGRLELEAIHSPGHTPGSMSYLLRDPDGSPWIVFTGDALFAGDVGRVDLLGVERMEEMAGLLYETLFDKLLALPDDLIVCPAHGAGSVCGSIIAERVWTTVGLERRLNPRLRHTDRDDFIQNVAQVLERPPYFRRTEALNLTGGAPWVGDIPVPVPRVVDNFVQLARDSVVVDTRDEMGFGAAHVPDALSIWLGGLASFAGWFLSYGTPVLLVNQTDDPVPAARRLIRMGYDALVGYLSGGVHAWLAAGRRSEAIEMVTVQDLCRRLDAGAESWILDVRGEEELESVGRIAGAHHIHITQLPAHLAEVPREQKITIFCGSGLRSMIAASLLGREGWDDVAVVLGGLAGWSSTTCPVELAE